MVRIGANTETGQLPRLFTGLEVPYDVQLALSLKRGGLLGSRWIDPENYHITLCFIGDVDNCLLYTSPSPRDRTRSRMPSSA